MIQTSNIAAKKICGKLQAQELQKSPGYVGMLHPEKDGNCKSGYYQCKGGKMLAE
jgi:hypothetical protein